MMKDIDFVQSYVLCLWFDDSCEQFFSRVLSGYHNSDQSFVLKRPIKIINLHLMAACCYKIILKIVHGIFFIE